MAVGLPDEAHSFLHWLHVASRLTVPRLHVAYTLDGRPGLGERDLVDVPGYRQSRPVLFGNGAADQHQLDIYGWVVDAAWTYEERGGRLHAAVWRAMAQFADFVAACWREPDAGIWEVRDKPQHHVHSKLMGWLALDRAVRLARAHRTRSSRVERWRRERDTLADDLRRRGFDGTRNTYVGAYGSWDLDAATLLVTTTGFEPANSPRADVTVRAIHRTLSAGGPLLYRYPPGTDGLPGTEGAFLACSFWLAQAMVRTGRREEAEEVFDAMCARSNDVGLFGDEMDPTTGEHLGNFPQALTHAALIQAGLALSPPTTGE
jgi:GH15 family glucan-1,4-alpha-glucosidase